MTIIFFAVGHGFHRIVDNQSYINVSMIISLALLIINNKQDCLPILLQYIVHQYERNKSFSDTQGRILGFQDIF
jgi:hypothetical protein